MSNPTPTHPQNPVPTENGYYWAKHRVFGHRVIVNVDGGTVYLFGMSTTFPAVDFTDWSRRITEPQPPAAPVAKGLDALAAISNQLARIPVESGRHEKFGRDKIERMLADLGAITELHFPALKAEIEQLRGIVGSHAYLDLDDNIYIQRVHPGAGSFLPDDKWYVADRDNPFRVYWHKRAIESSPKFDSMLSALAWLRSKDGKAAIEAAKEASCR